MTLAYAAIGVALLAAIVALWLARLWRRWRGSRRAKLRAARAGKGEDAAARLLVAAGYRVLDRLGKLKH